MNSRLAVVLVKGRGVPYRLREPEGEVCAVHREAAFALCSFLVVLCLSRGQ